MKNMFVLNPVLENLNPIFPGNKQFYTLWPCAGIFFRHWLRRLCNISLKAGEEIKFKTPSHRYIHSLGLTSHNVFFLSVYSSSASSSSSSDPDGPWRTSSYHLLVRVFIWIRPCNKSCETHQQACNDAYRYKHISI